MTKRRGKRDMAVASDKGLADLELAKRLQCLSEVQARNKAALDRRVGALVDIGDDRPALLWLPELAFGIAA